MAVTEAAPVDATAATNVLAGRRVVFVLPWSELAGAEWQALVFARHLLDRGASVEVCALTEADGPAIQAFREAGITWGTARIDWYGTRWSKARELGGLARRLRSMRPDVLLPYCTPANVFCGLVWRATGAATCVWHQQDVLPSRFGSGLVRRALRGTPLILSNAAHALPYLESLGAPSARLHVVPPFGRVPESATSRAKWRERLGLSSDSRVVSMLASLGENKDHRTLLLAWPRVVGHAKDTEAVLVLAGRSARGGEERAKALAYDLGLGRSVRFLGYVDDVGGLLDASDLAVLSSYSEGLPNAVIEPMAKGLPVVASDVPGVREAVGDGVAVLAAPGDHEALARAIVSALEDAGLGEAARSRNPASVAERFGPGTLVRHASLVAEALAARRESS